MQSLMTRRLSLSPLQLDDLDLFHQINTNPYVRRYLWDDKIIDLVTAEDILKTNQKQFEQSHCGLWKINIIGHSEVIGYTGLWYFFDEPQPQLIYALLPAYSNMGYATEAAQAMVDYAFEDLGFSYLIAATDEPHLASQKVAQRLGMSFHETRIEDGKPTLFYRIQNS